MRANVLFVTKQLALDSSIVNERFFFIWANHHLTKDKDLQIAHIS